ncbi:amino acid adenylation domain-containing protein [Enterovibrio sp. ZSDZ35]|uniref:Amino acid adenylation domain-containing protein n=1 Tax=Enterovibrio qingdaonensis TaxID=2899818 RepID=A0ABT5QI96_9GAMM|nr:amino acid adenylation domain-containing protein [Enterovibrio sp. ZSDZ35]MDD1780046.1 amino acid adenylation domain-containing protein [Enterovibrio sp. ZSDZ35]
MTVILNSVLFPPSPSEQPSAHGSVFNLAPLSKLSPEDRRKFVKYGRGRLEKPAFSTLNQAFEYHAARSPHAIAAMHGSRAISYGELNQEAEKLATLLQKAGVKQGESVGLFITRSIPMLVGMLACLKIGANYVPQHANVAPAKQLEHIVDVARIRIILTLSTHRKQLPTFNNSIVLELDTLLKSFEFRALDIAGKRPTKPSDVCFVLFTSGTTGKPNGVQVTHRNVCNVVLTSPGNLGVTPGMRVAQILSIAFDMSAWEIYVALCHGATLLIRDSVIEHTTSNANVIIATPSILGQINPDNCEDVKVVAVAGEPCPRPLAEKWAIQCRFYNGCGPTETTIINTAKWFQTGGALTIGKPTPNNTIYILNDCYEPCDIGEIGEMWAGGAGVTKGYLANASLSQERYRPDPFLGDGHIMFRTRDLGRWTENGELEHFGRTDDQVKIRGYRVELDSVSAILETLDNCRLAITMKVDAEKLVSFVVPAVIDEATAIAHVAASLPYYSVPAKVIAFDQLPLTPRGKIDKRKLLDIYKNHASPSHEPDIGNSAS